MSSKLRQRLPIVAIAVLAIGGYTLGPAIAANFLTKKSAKKTFVTKKSANKKFLKKSTANDTFAKIGDAYTKTEADSQFAEEGDAYTKTEADSQFAEEGDAYTKAESDANFAPASEQVTLAVPSTGWEREPGASAVYVPTAVQAVFQENVAADPEDTYYGGIPLDLSGSATLLNARICFTMGGDAGLNLIQLQQSEPTQATPNPAPNVVANSGPAVLGTDDCRTMTPAGTVTVEPTDVLGFAVQANYFDTGGEATLTITSATVTLQT